MELTARMTPRSHYERIDLLGPSGELVGQLAPTDPVEVWDQDAADDALYAHGYQIINHWARAEAGTWEARVKLA